MRATMCLVAILIAGCGGASEEGPAVGGDADTVVGADTASPAGDTGGPSTPDSSIVDDGVEDGATDSTIGDAGAPSDVVDVVMDVAAPEDGVEDAGLDGGPDGSPDGDDVGTPPVDSGPQPICTAGETRCSPAVPLTVERCEVGGLAWAPLEECPEACVDGACAQLVCAPGGSFCEGDVLRACNAQGTGSTVVTDCPLGCTDSATSAACVQCEAGTKGCLDAGTSWECVHPTEPPTETVCGAGLATCLGGGCVGLLAWTAGDDEADALLWFAIHTGACALMGPSLPEGTPCWALDTTKLNAPITEDGFAAWLCDGAASGALSADDFLPLDAWSEADIFGAALSMAGCGGAPLLELPADSLIPGHPVGDLCQGYDPANGAVRVGPCPIP